MRPPQDASNIAEVIARLDALIADATAEGSRLGYFSTLYRSVTQQVAKQIAAGKFDDGPRMDRLDTNFANRYFAALRAHLAPSGSPKAWGVAFATASDPDAIALQHLLLGINAHINVDLGAATAAVCRKSELASIRKDFDRINGVIADLTDAVEGRLGEVSPRIADLDRIGGAADERLAIFSAAAARENAWFLAETLAATPSFLRPAVEKLADRNAAFLGRLIAHPPDPAGVAIKKVRSVEQTDVRRVLDVLGRVGTGGG